MAQSDGTPRSGIDPAWYLGATLLGFLLVQVALFLMAVLDASFPPWLELSIVLSVPLVAFALWSQTRRTVEPQSTVRKVFLALLLLVWLVAVTDEVFRERGFNTLALLLPLLIVMLWTRPPAGGSVVRAGDAYVIGLTVVSVAALFLEVANVIPSWYQALMADGDGFAAVERASYWVPLAGPLGLDGRWAGPFLHPNFAGMAAAVVLLWSTGRAASSFSRRARRQVTGVWGALVVAGLLMLTLTSSRTSLGAAFAGSVVLAIAVVTWGRPQRSGSWVLLMGVPSALALLLGMTWTAAGGMIDAAATVADNSSLSGRTEVWATYAAMWRESPWFGVGDVGIAAAIDTGQLPSWAHHAHNLGLDAATRYGVGFALLVAALLVTSLVATTGSARRGVPWALALVVMLLAEGLTETPFKWLFLTPTLAALILATMTTIPDHTSGGGGGPPWGGVNLRTRSGTAPSPPPPPAPERGTDPAPNPAPPPAAP